MANGVLTTGLRNDRGLVADLNVGGQPVTEMRNPRRLRLILGPVPQVLKAASGEVRAGAGSQWLLY